MYPVSIDEFFNVASASLKSNKAAGYDDFKPSTIKQVLPYISKPLTHIFNLSFKTGLFPKKLKTEKALPVFKKGDPQAFAKLSPFFLTLMFRKNY